MIAWYDDMWADFRRCPPIYYLCLQAANLFSSPRPKYVPGPSERGASQRGGGGGGGGRSHGRGLLETRGGRGEGKRAKVRSGHDAAAMFR